MSPNDPEFTVAVFFFLDHIVQEVGPVPSQKSKRKLLPPAVLCRNTDPFESF